MGKLIPEDVLSIYSMANIVLAALGHIDELENSILANGIRETNSNETVKIHVLCSCLANQRSFVKELVSEVSTSSWPFLLFFKFLLSSSRDRASFEALPKDFSPRSLLLNFLIINLAYVLGNKLDE